MQEEINPQHTRPLSPHLGIYKAQISSVLSIFHRATGAVLFGGISLIMWWFTFWVLSKFDGLYFQIFDHLSIRICLVALSFCYFYHFSTGIRHLIWDTGRCFSIKAINITGWLAVSSACILTSLFWFI
jgi:succinate dehydrogenase / fumarate reductase cytochrome b subunit